MKKLLGSFFLITLSQAVFASLPFYPVNFPRDEGAHFTNVPYDYKLMMEWWNVNGKLTANDNKQFGFDITFFNPTLKFRKQLLRQPILHIQLADLENMQTIGTKKFYEPNVGKVSTTTLDITLAKDYVLKKITYHGKEAYELHAQGKKDDTWLSIDLILTPTSLPFLANENGLIPMPNDTNSYFYTIPHFNIVGTLRINNQTYAVKNDQGDTWMSHQWGDFAQNDNGWELFNVRLKNGLLANILINLDEKNKPIGGLGDVILPDGEKRIVSFQDMNVKRDEYWYDKLEGLTYPTAFTINIPSLGLSITSNAQFKEQELNGYWNGYSNASAVYEKQDVNGFSYTKLYYNGVEIPKSEQLKNLGAREIIK